MKLEILPSAWDDLADGYYFYESQSAGLGDRFREIVIDDIDSLARSAGIHRRVFGYHRMLVRVFPYAAYYSVTESTVLIRAVIDCRSDPRLIRKKLR